MGFGVSGFGAPKHSAANSQKLGAVPSNIQIEMTLPMPFNKSRFMIVVEIVLCYLCMKVKKIFTGRAYQLLARNADAYPKTFLWA